MKQYLKLAVRANGLSSSKIGFDQTRLGKTITVVHLQVSRLVHLVVA